MLDPDSANSSSFAPPRGPGARTTGNFDRIAWCYDALAGLVFGGSLRAAQRAALAGLPPGAPHVLILGGGTGWVLGEVLRRRPRATVLYLEASGPMLARAAARLRRTAPGAAGQVEFRRGTEAALAPAERFDALATFFVLDCFPAAALGPALARLAAARQPAAPWLLADFCRPRRGWQRALLGTMYWFFGAVAALRVRQLPDFHAALAGLGLHPAQPAFFFGGAVEGTVFRPAAPSGAPGTEPLN
ncbi:methyltransferase [Hymenobacter caeli]|uniref:SAM-dependent methyltransferase n=1 Tax=Hymenobacter caeli TaxID=2735894 RepID=A0ABX2FK14_9BACT|nr:methyltransferase [Hymenobacter caeli]NRT17455.1 SAM-dependent methyltransferase [Hymenobacter caeli]